MTRLANCITPGWETGHFNDIEIGTSLMNSDALLFCAFDDLLLKSICSLLCTTFNTSHDELLDFYQALRDDFNLSEWPQPVWANRCFFNSADSDFQSHYDNASAVACDLPSLLSKGGQNTVVIVAQDPYNILPDKRMRIGTPYALHIKRCREEKHTRRYLQLIDVLFQLNYQVYLTDIHKVYVHGAKLPRKDRLHFSVLLKQEIETIAPKAVITWGCSATHSVTKLKLNTSHFSYPHPSGQARGAWAKLIGARATDRRIFDYWQQNIARQLSNL